MVIRILLTVIFVIIAIFKVKRMLIKEVDNNPYIRKVKGNKLKDFLFSAIPYTLFKVALVYVCLMVTSVIFLQSKCNTLILIDTFEYDALIKDYVENDTKNATYIYEFSGENHKIKDIDKLTINIADSNYIELYELRSDSDIINIFLYGMFERQIIVYRESE